MADQRVDGEQLALDSVQVLQVLCSRRSQKSMVRTIALVGPLRRRLSGTTLKWKAQRIVVKIFFNRSGSESWFWRRCKRGEGGKYTIDSYIRSCGERRQLPRTNDDSLAVAQLMSPPMIQCDTARYLRISHFVTLRPNIAKISSPDLRLCRQTSLSCLRLHGDICGTQLLLASEAEGVKARADMTTSRCFRQSAHDGPTYISQGRNRGAMHAEGWVH